METSQNPTIMDVRSVVEAVSTEDDDAPVYQVESLCMRCGENVSNEHNIDHKQVEYDYNEKNCFALCDRGQRGSC